MCVRTACIKLTNFTDLQINARNSGCVMNLRCYLFLFLYYRTALPTDFRKFMITF